LHLRNEKPSNNRQDTPDNVDAVSENDDNKQLSRNEVMDYPQLFDLFDSVWGADAKNEPVVKSETKIAPIVQEPEEDEDITVASDTASSTTSSTSSSPASRYNPKPGKNKRSRHQQSNTDDGLDLEILSVVKKINAQIDPPETKNDTKQKVPVLVTKFLSASDPSEADLSNALTALGLRHPHVENTVVFLKVEGLTNASIIACLSVEQVHNFKLSIAGKAALQKLVKMSYII